MDQTKWVIFCNDIHHCEHNFASSSLMLVNYTGCKTRVRAPCGHVWIAVTGKSRKARNLTEKYIFHWDTMKQDNTVTDVFISWQNKRINCDEYFYWYVTFKGCSSDHLGCKSHCAITKTNWYGSKFTDISNNKIQPILLWWLANHHHSLNHHRYDSSFIGYLFNLLSYLQLSIMTEE